MLCKTGIALLSFNLVTQMRKGCWLCFFFSLLSLFAGSVLSQTNSEYLNAITGEATNLTLDQEARPSAQSSTPEGSADKQQNTSDNTAGAIKEFVPGLNVEQFEKLLKNNYMGSYLFYRSLEDDDKKEAYIFYLDNPDSVSLREKILQLRKK